MATGEYAGESIAKKVARVRLYRRTREALVHRIGHQGLSEARALILPGPEAAEVGCIKHILRLKPENVVGIDRDAEACAMLEKRLPGAKTCCADLEGSEVQLFIAEQIRAAQQGFEFVHLDLMGNLSDLSSALYTVWSLVTREEGVFAATYLRGREVPGRNPRTDAQRAASDGMLADLQRVNQGDSRKLLKLLAPDPARTLAHLASLNEAVMRAEIFTSATAEGKDPQEEWRRIYDEIGRAHDEKNEDRFWAKRRAHHDQFGFFTPIACYAYHGDVSPMGVLAAQRVMSSVHESEEYSKMRYDLRRDTTCVIKRDAMVDLLAEADSLARTYAPEAVAEILNVSTGTLGAWRAHRTMGTYA